MKKTIIILMLFCSCSKVQFPQKQLLGDTIPTILSITNSRLPKLQMVPGFKVQQQDSVVGFLSVRKKQFSHKVKVWGYQ